MNKQTIIAIAVVLVIVIGGGIYALVNRSVLKSYFQTGDKPTAEQQAMLDGTGTDVDKPTTGQFNVAVDSKASEPTEKQKQEGVTTVAPANKKSYGSAEIGAGVVFRWTPLVPKPQEPVTYRLKVWQLMQGQNSTEAMRTNKPIVTKDVVDVTETTAVGIYTGPCRPPYLCEFVWSVDAVVSGQTFSPAGEPATFSVTEDVSKAGSR
jgi:hypothetical protein